MKMRTRMLKCRESRLPEEISVTSDMKIKPPLESKEELKSLLMKSERRE